MTKLQNQKIEWVHWNVVYIKKCKTFKHTFKKKDIEDFNVKSNLYWKFQHANIYVKKVKIKRSIEIKT